MIGAMNALYTHAWMQKHPTPTNNSGDFHWHPERLPSAIRATLTELATRSRGRPASAWIIDSGYVAWARTFSAVAPSDRRRYTGLVATVGQLESAGEQPSTSATTHAPRWSPADRWAMTLPDLLSHLPLPEPRPFAGQEPSATASLSAHQRQGPRPRMVDADAMRELFDDRDPQVASAVYYGGQAFAHAAHDSRLPALFGALMSWIPQADRAQPRTGMFTENRAAVEAVEHERATDNMLHYLSGAWMCPSAITRTRPDYPTRAWHLVCELAQNTSMTVRDLFTQLTDISLSWDSAEELLSHLRRTELLSEAAVRACDERAPSPLMGPSATDAGHLWNRLLHYWGRGFLTDVSSERLAGLLALRIVADHLFYLDAPHQRALPERYYRRLCYEALLPRERVQDLRAGLRRCIPSLSQNREDQLG